MERQKLHLNVNNPEIKKFEPAPIVETKVDRISVSIDKALDVDKVAITPVKIQKEDNTIKLAKDYKVEGVKLDESSISILSSKYEDKGN